MACQRAQTKTKAKTKGDADYDRTVRRYQVVLTLCEMVHNSKAARTVKGSVAIFVLNLQRCATQREKLYHPQMA